MADAPDPKLKLHLMAEKALGLNALPVGRKRGGAKAPGANQSGAAPAALPRREAPAPVRSEPPAPRVSVPPPKPAPVATPAPAVPSFFPSLKDTPFEVPVLPTAEKRVRLQQMDDGEVKGCTFCRLCETRTKTVFGEGDVDARVMFIGEGPGENEDLTGRPFVGRAGELLDKQIGAMGLRRDQVFIANVVKCRPPGNRAPLPDETAACTPYLMRQIEIVRPQAIVTLGLPATKFILADEKITMGRARGQWHEFRGIAVRPTYHPAYLLRNYTAETRKMVWDDLQAVMQKLGLKAKRAD